MVRSTRVNCKECKSFDANEYCKKCYDKLDTQRFVQFVEVNKLKKELGKYKVINRTFKDFLAMMVGYILFPILGAVGLCNYMRELFSFVSFNKNVLYFNFNNFDIITMFTGFLVFVFGVYILNMCYEQLYIKQEDD